MQTIKALGVSAIAEYCGVKPTAVHQWIYRHGPNSNSKTPLPDPVATVTQTLAKGTDQKFTFGWAVSDLPRFRDWYATLKGWGEATATARWAEVDKAIEARYNSKE